MNDDIDETLMTDGEAKPPPMTNVADVKEQIADALLFRAQVWGKVCHALACPLPTAEALELMALHEGCVRELDALRKVQMDLITHGRIQS